MLYASALVLGSLAVAQAAPGNARHASFHNRRNVPRQSEGEKINFDALARDTVDYAKLDWASILKTVDFNNINYGPTPTPVAPSSSSSSSTAAAVPTTLPPPPPPAPAAAKPAAPKPASPSGASNAVSDIFDGVEDFSKKIGVAVAGVSAQASTGDIRLGSGGPLTINHVNNNGQTQFLYCWKSAGYTGMTVNVNAPAIAVRLPSDGTPVTTSHGEAVPFACAAANVETTLANFGGVNATWFEAEYRSSGNGVGAFDISRLINPHGSPIAAKGSKCTSDFSACYYQCKDSSLPFCGEANSYSLVNCDAANGGGGGYDTAMKGDGGGCAMSTDGEQIEVRYG